MRYFQSLTRILNMGSFELFSTFCGVMITLVIPVTLTVYERNISNSLSRNVKSYISIIPYQANGSMFIKMYSVIRFRHHLV